MTIWDTLTGRKSSSPSTQSSATPSGDSAPTTVFADAPFVPEVQQVSDFLTPDISQLHPLAGLSRDDLEYLSLDESIINDLPGSNSALPSRGWSDDLCYGTGTCYLTALSIGGAWGMAEGLRKTPSTAPPKIRLNGVLNAVTRRGPFLGNSAGVIALVYNGINSYIGYARGKHDAANSIAAGALAGAIFKSTRGVKPMMISSGIVASVAGTWAMTRKVLF